MEDLAYLDSAPTKKIRFVRYYNQAREDALQEKYIIGEWHEADLFLKSSEKVLKSKQVLDTTIISRTSSKRPTTSSSHLATTKNKRQLMEAQNELVQSENLPQSVRSFFGTTTKAFEQLYFDKAVNLQQINAQAIRLKEFTQKSKKKNLLSTPTNAL